MTGRGGTRAGRGGWRAHRLRIAGWSAAAVALLAPWVAMQFTHEVEWTAGDFALFAVMLLAAGLALELAVRAGRGSSYRAGATVAVAAAFLLAWVTGAVGLVGSEDDPANLMYAGVLAVAVLGAALARLRPAGMARAMLAAAGAQALAGAAALTLGLGRPESGPAEILAGNGLFAALFLASALLFRRAAAAAAEP